MLIKIRRNEANPNVEKGRLIYNNVSLIVIEIQIVIIVVVIIVIVVIIVVVVIIQSHHIDNSVDNN